MVKVRDLLEVKGNVVWSVSPSTSTFDAILTLAEKDIGALLVKEDDVIVGIISERDFARRIAGMGGCDFKTPVREIMTDHVISVTPEQTIEECMELITNYHIRHLPVVENEKLAGLISVGDVVNAMISSQEMTIKDLKNYIEAW